MQGAENPRQGSFGGCFRDHLPEIPPVGVLRLGWAGQLVLEDSVSPPTLRSEPQVRESSLMGSASLCPDWMSTQPPGFSLARRCSHHPFVTNVRLLRPPPGGAPWIRFNCRASSRGVSKGTPQPVAVGDLLWPQWICGQTRRLAGWRGACLPVTHAGYFPFYSQRISMQSP
jgi:hypothetical protein